MNSTTFYVKNGSTVNVMQGEHISATNDLQLGTYVVKKHPMSGAFYLEQISDFKAPSKVYGDTISRAERIYKTYMNRERNCGVLLTGDKGSGKTVLAKYLSGYVLKEGIPTIIIDQEHQGTEFKDFLNSITCRVLIIFDEFEKLFSHSGQEDILTIFDGVSSSKKLFVLTCNSEGRLDNHLINRPGRIHYLFRYNKIGEDVVRDICADRGVSNENMENILRIQRFMGAFSFDMLIAIIEECAIHNCSAKEALEVLNIEVGNTQQKYTVEFFYKNVKIHTSESVHVNDLTAFSAYTSFNPRKVESDVFKKDFEIGEEESEWFELEIDNTCVTDLDEASGQVHGHIEDDDVSFIMTPHAKITHHDMLYKLF